MKAIFLLLLFIAHFASAQMNEVYKVHSHNDYLQNVPFWKALSAGASSIEADVFLVNDDLLVAHGQAELDPIRNLKTLYLDPLQQAISLQLLHDTNLQLLIDVKSEPVKTLATIVKTLKLYPNIIANPSISIVISGNRPEEKAYTDYPDFILFDQQRLDGNPGQKVRDKIGLISLDFKNYSRWNGKGRLTADDLALVKAAIKSAKQYKKPIRFWGTPDSKTAWKALAHLGVDYINTDHPSTCASYLKTLPKREYRNTVFSEVYRPTFENDGKPVAPKNIILLIGDGNGLAQISATALANKGDLSLTQLLHIGLIKTQSEDDFTTDSAGAGTALATGHKAPNRAIGVDQEGKCLENLTELLARQGYTTGIITTDEITGATPAAFFAHQVDRGMVEEITADLSESVLSLYVSSYTPNTERSGFTIVKTAKDIANSKDAKIAYYFPETDSMIDHVDQLSDAVTYGLQSLEAKKAPFFLMVEGAKIDSYGHANDIGGIITEGIGFDKAVTEALKFADRYQNTLVLITADHETGGLTIPQGNIRTSEIEGDFTTDDHTGILVPVFAYGPMSNVFQGVYENNELSNKLMSVLDLPKGE